MLTTIKGVFSLYFVGQDQKNMAHGVMAESDNDLELKQVVHMPASGFMYMVSMIKNMLEDPRMEAEFNKLVAAGFLPAGDATANSAEDAAAEEKTAAKKRPAQVKSNRASVDTGHMSITHQPANLTLAQIQQMIGGVMLLSQHSPLHRRYVVAEWLQRILPAFELNQFCYYEDEHGRQLPFVIGRLSLSRSEMSCFLVCANISIRLAFGPANLHSRDDCSIRAWSRGRQ